MITLVNLQDDSHLAIQILSRSELKGYQNLLLLLRSLINFLASWKCKATWDYFNTGTSYPQQLVHEFNGQRNKGSRGLGEYASL